MSLSSMAELSVKRMKFVPRNLHGVARGLPPSEAPAPTPAPPAAPSAAAVVSRAIDQVTRYIPAEIVTLYVAWSTPKVEADARFNIFLIFLMLTPVAVWGTVGLKARAANLPLPLSPREWPWWNMVAAAIAFVSWAYALPQSALKDTFLYAQDYSAAVLLTVTVVLASVGALVGPEKAAPGAA